MRPLRTVHVYGGMVGFSSARSVSAVRIAARLPLAKRAVPLGSAAVEASTAEGEISSLPYAPLHPTKNPSALLDGQQIKDMQQRIRNNVDFAVKARNKLFQDLARASRENYAPTPCERVIKTPPKPEPNKRYGEHELCEVDCVQLYMRTLRFVLCTDDPRDTSLYDASRASYAEGAISIIRAWCAVCKGFGANEKDEQAILSASWATCVMVRCLELLKYTYKGYAASGIEKVYLDWYDKVVKPSLTRKIRWVNNWNAAQVEALMAVAIFRDDPVLFEQQVAEYKRILPFIIKPSGYTEEVLRPDDVVGKVPLMHAQFSLGSLAHCCQLAYNAKRQDLFSYEDYRLARGMEYVSSIILDHPGWRDDVEIQEDKRMSGLKGVDQRLIKAWPQGAWGLSVTAFEGLGGQGGGGAGRFMVPKSRKVMEGLGEFPWLCWGWTNLTHRKQVKPPTS